MHSIIVIIPLAVLAQTNAKDTWTYSSQDSMDQPVDKFWDNLLERVLEVSPLNHTQLDSTMLGKPAGALATQARSNPLALGGLHTQVNSRACGCPVPAVQWQGPGNVAVLGSRSISSSAVMRPSSQFRSSVRASASPERTYIMVKPDGVQRGLVGEIISRFERKGFYLKGLKLFNCPEELAKEHYGDLKEKPFFPDLVGYICSGPVVAMVWEGKGVVKSARKLIGATNPLESEPGTIRGDFAVEVGRNVIHGSDSIENGEREIGLWFGSGEGMAEWTPAMIPWLREEDRE
jgi:nucleoside-diphosphate kinase